MLTVFLVFSCHSKKPLAPKQEILSIEEIPNSTIHLPISVDLDDIERMVNQEVEKVMGDDMDNEMIGQRGWTIRIKKNEDIKLSIEENDVRFLVPLDIWLEKDIKITKVNAEGDIELNFKTNYSIERNWTLNTETMLENYVWKEKPTINLGIVNLPIESLANVIVDRSKAMIAKQIDEQFQQNFALKDYLEVSWEKMQRPTKISEEYNAWVKIYPKKIGMSPLQTIDRKIESVLAIEAKTNISIEPLKIDSSLIPLLPFQKLEMDKTGFQMNVHVDIPYKQMEQIAEATLVNQEFREKNKSVKIESIDIYPLAEKLIFDTKVSGDYNGSIFLEGIPIYSDREKKFMLDKMDFELSTKNFLQKSMAWIFKKDLKRKLKESIVYNMEDELKELKSTIQNQFDNLILNENINLTGTVNELDIGRLFLQDDHLKIIVKSNGALNLTIDKLKMLEDN